jgi:hypothetical protein
MAIVLGVAAPSAAVDGVPTFDVGPSCRASASRAEAGADATACVGQEHRAREELQRQWQSFTRDDKSGCVPLTTMGGSPTYTELLTCLEMSREVRNLRGRQAPSTTGSAR